MIARAIAAVAIAAIALPALAAPVDAGQEVWSMQFDTFYHGTMDVQLLRDGEKVAAGFAFDTVRNPPKLLDTSRLKVVDGRLQGPMILLDHAPKEQRDLKLVEEIARWCEERHIDWSRTPPAKPSLTKPNGWGWSRAAGTGTQIAGRFAYVAARLGQETGDALWTAKSRGLIQGILAAQDPVLGGYPYHFHRTTEDCAGNLYDSVEACDRVAAVAALSARGSAPGSGAPSVR